MVRWCFQSRARARLPYLLLLSGGLLSPAWAQRVPPPMRWTPSLYLDNRNPVASAAAVRVIGVNLGVTPAGKNYRIGFSGYTLRRNYAEYYATQGRGKSQHGDGHATPGLNLLYFTPSFTYTVVRRRFFEVSVPVNAGIGRSHYTLLDAQGQLLTDSRHVFIPAEAGVGILLKPTRWVGVSGGVGYRSSLTQEEFADDFTGLYYCYRLNLFVQTIWSAVRQRAQPTTQPYE